MRLSGNVMTRARPAEPVPALEVSAAAGLTAVAAAGDEVVRRGIDGLLRCLPEVAVVHACATAEDFGTLARRVRPDVVIAAAADHDWLAQHHQALADRDVTVLVLVDHATVGELSGSASPSVDGFLWQPTLTVDQLLDRLRQRRRGELYMPPDLVRALLERTDGDARPSQLGAINLTDREREALALLVQGLSNKQIARRLAISSHGAKRLVASIMLKLDAPNRTLAAVTAVRAGLLDSESTRSRG